MLQILLILRRQAFGQRSSHIPGSDNRIRKKRHCGDIWILGDIEQFLHSGDQRHVSIGHLFELLAMHVDCLMEVRPEGGAMEETKGIGELVWKISFRQGIIFLFIIFCTWKRRDVEMFWYLSELGSISQRIHAVKQTPQALNGSIIIRCQSLNFLTIIALANKAKLLRIFFHQYLSQVFQLSHSDPSQFSLPGGQLVGIVETVPIISRTMADYHHDLLQLTSYDGQQQQDGQQEKSTDNKIHIIILKIRNILKLFKNYKLCLESGGLKEEGSGNDHLQVRQTWLSYLLELVSRSSVFPSLPITFRYGLLFFFCFWVFADVSFQGLTLLIGVSGCIGALSSSISSFSFFLDDSCTVFLISWTSSRFLLCYDLVNLSVSLGIRFIPLPFFLFCSLV